MDEELQAGEVIELILGALERAQVEGMDPRHDLLDLVGRAIADHPEDVGAQAAAALSCLVAYGMVVDQSDLSEMLESLSKIEGLNELRDVEFVDEDLRGFRRRVSLRESLPDYSDSKMSSEELRQIEIFVRRFMGPEDSFDGDKEPDDPAPDGSNSGPRMKR